MIQLRLNVKYKRYNHWINYKKHCLRMSGVKCNYKNKMDSLFPVFFKYVRI